MKKKYSSFFWSDNWYIENGKAWFVAGEYNAFFQLDMAINQCVFVAELPVTNGLRLNSRCIKCYNDIFCIPDTGDSIWVYELDKSQFRKIGIKNPDKVRLMIVNFWQVDKKIFAVSMGLKQVIEVNIRDKRIENYYGLCDISNERIGLCIKVGRTIFCPLSDSNQVCQFSIITKEAVKYSIPDIADGLCTICFDGEKYWLSGFRKQIYVWNKENNTVKIIGQFPEQFGIYNFEGNTSELIDYKTVLYDTPTFADSIATEQYIWFIPFQTNKIIYIDKDTFELHVFEIAEEEETEDSLTCGRMHSKYLLQYVKERRYIGLYSLKNNCIWEIDSLKIKVEKKHYSFSRECLEQIEKKYIYENVFGDILYDNQSICRTVLEKRLFDVNMEEKKKETLGIIGARIYEQMKRP